MTDQEQFDKAVGGVLAQGKPAVKNPDAEYPYCRYRTETGLKCALGQLIPDELYDPMMEGRGAHRVLTDWPELASLEIDKSLAGVLQDAHDYAATGKELDFVTEFKRRARNIAEDRGLDTTVLD